MNIDVGGGVAVLAACYVAYIASRLGSRTQMYIVYYLVMITFCIRVLVQEFIHMNLPFNKP